ncbi:MAG TPA: hypothetical protein VFM88_05605 [Vicinamibacteria bacterium]|nr:hypothetical protein [Vicinamibacteria bacterium]
MTSSDEKLLELLQDIRDSSRDTAAAAQAALAENRALIRSTRTVIKWLAVIMGIPIAGTLAVWLHWAFAWVRYWLAQ